MVDLSTTSFHPDSQQASLSSSKSYNISFTMLLHNCGSSFLFKSKTFFRFIFIHIHSKSTTFSSLTVFLQERNSKKRSDYVLFCFVLCFLLSFTDYNIIYIHLFQIKEKERSEMFSLCDYNIIYIHFTFLLLSNQRERAKR